MPKDDAHIIEVLRQTELFRGVEEKSLRDLVAACDVVTLKKDQTLFEYGSIGSSMFVLINGSLRVFRGHRTLRVLEPGEIIGEMALIDPAPRSASVRGVSAMTELFEIPKAAFDEYLITDRHALPTLVRTLNRRLRELTDTTQASFEEVRMVLHDTLNMLCVHEFAAIVLDSLSPEDTDNRELLEQLLRTGEDARKTMRKALNKACGVAEEYQREPAALDVIVRDCIEKDLSIHKDVKKFPVEFVLETPIEPVPCNSIDIKRVISNLVINAAQAMNGEGKITVRMRQDPDITLIEVNDTGPGIPPEVLEHIFEPQFTTKETGNGLGLASCREIIEKRHDGKLDCETTIGVGTSFVCKLPK